MERTYKYNNSNVTIKFGNILESKAEVIVSSDDCFVTMGGGVSRSIVTAEGSNRIPYDAMKQIPANLGDVLVTTAGTLSQKFIFHAITIGTLKGTPLKVLPKEQVQEYIIRNSVTRCFDLMRSLNVSSIAFPTIGGGTAGIPLQRIANVMSEAMSDFLAKTNVTYNVELYIYTGQSEPDYMQYIDFFERFASHADYKAKQSERVVDVPSPAKGENYDIFVSYSRADSTVADEIVKSLDELNLKCWIDRTGQYSGKNYKSVIVDKIRNSHIILFLSSQNSNQSENVIKEIAVAVGYKKQIIPIRLDNANYADSIAYDLTGIDYIDYQKDDNDMEQKIVTQLTLIKDALSDH